MSTPEPIPDLLQALQACSREPIHIPGRIQPHGALLALREPELAVVQVSASLQEVAGLGPEELLGRPVDRLLGEEQAGRFRRLLQRPDPEAANPLSFVLGKAPFDAIVHRTSQALLLELEPAVERGGVEFEGFYHLVNAAVQRLQTAPDLDALLRAAVEEVRRLTGFDRVMLYRFDPEWNGEVIAESRAPELEPFLGLRYPASDIPAQARQLYTLNRLRLIADVAARPAPLVPERAPDGAPLDLSHSVLRSVSPVHIEYLKNMGVGASMSVSLLRGERLWGLIACHHRTARPVAYVARIACDFLGQVLSLQLAVREGQRDLQERSRLEGIQARLLQAVSRAPDLFQALAEHPAELCGAVNASGAALVFDGRILSLGEAPPAEEVRGLIRALEAASLPELHATDCLAREYPEGERWKEAAAGVLAAQISEESRILWFRPEVVRVVNWAGQPEKAVRVEEDRVTLHPRQSFELWKQVVHLRSAPWTPVELEVAAALRGALVDRFLQQAEARARQDIERANELLRRSNEELDSFTHIVSHDLKEPLRGIQNYSDFVLEDYGELLPEDGRAKLEAMTQLSRRTQVLIDNLLRFSRLGRTDLAYQSTQVDRVVDEALALLQPLLQERQAEVRVQRPMPVVRADRSRLGEVFNNLVTNALKYNDSPRPVVEIGARGAAGAVPQFFVRDNGIGIRERDREAVFRLFHRLHTRTRYGGGTGAGLTLVRRIIEKHGGRIWIESSPGMGTTFYFTLAPEGEGAPDGTGGPS